MHSSHRFDNQNTGEENTLLYVKSTHSHAPICKCISDSHFLSTPSCLPPFDLFLPINNQHSLYLKQQLKRQQGFTDWYEEKAEVRQFSAHIPHDHDGALLLPTFLFIRSFSIKVSTQSTHSCHQTTGFLLQLLDKQ